MDESYAESPWPATLAEFSRGPKNAVMGGGIERAGERVDPAKGPTKGAQAVRRKSAEEVIKKVPIRHGKNNTIPSEDEAVEYVGLDIDSSIESDEETGLGNVGERRGDEESIRKKRAIEIRILERRLKDRGIQPNMKNLLLLRLDYLKDSESYMQNLKKRSKAKQAAHFWSYFGFSFKPEEVVTKKKPKELLLHGRGTKM